MRITPQQNAILIALTRDHLLRTVENLSIETGIPKASVRRVLSELRRKYLPETASCPLGVCALLVFGRL